MATESQKEPAQEAIRKLKWALCNAPVLAQPRQDRPFLLCTDASLTGLGAVLAQCDDDGRERPVAYWGRTLTGPETRYTIPEIELLAIVCSVAHFRTYLYSTSGRKFVIITDHAALCWLHSNKDTTGGGAASRLSRGGICDFSGIQL